MQKRNFPVVSKQPVSTKLFSVDRNCMGISFSDANLSLFDDIRRFFDQMGRFCELPEPMRGVGRACSLCVLYVCVFFSYTAVNMHSLFKG